MTAGRLSNRTIGTNGFIAEANSPHISNSHLNVSWLKHLIGFIVSIIQFKRYITQCRVFRLHTTCFLWCWTVHRVKIFIRKMAVDFAWIVQIRIRKERNHTIIVYDKSIFDFLEWTFSIEMSNCDSSDLNQQHSLDSYTQTIRVKNISRLLFT